MPKRETERVRAFRKEMARMIIDLRQWIDAPLIMIGQATLTLIDQGEPVTIEAIRELVEALDDADSAELAARTLKYLDDHRTTSSS